MSALASWPLVWAADNRLISLDLGSYGTETFKVPGLVFLILGIMIVAYALGIWIANLVRMKDYGWKIGLILATLATSLAISLFGQYKLGVDLQGGVILVYEVDEQETLQLAEKDQQVDWDMGRLVGVLSERLNDSGLKEIIVRPFGPRQVEIVVPEVDENEVAKVKELIITGGMLQFMVVATEIKDAQLFELAKERAANPPDPEKRNQRPVVNDEGVQEGFWARMGREKSANNPDKAEFRDPSILQNGLIRDGRTGAIIDIPADQRFQFSHAAFQRYLDEQGIKDIDALMVYDVDYNIRGETDLGPSSTGTDQSLRPCIFFTMRGEGVFKMGNLTARNIQRKLAIIFDNELKSAPVINDKIDTRGEITGDFSQEEVQFIVDILKSGSLPVVLQKKPLSENTIGAILGLDTIQKGSWSIVIALSLVLVFLVGYYRFAGLVASFALALNLLLTVAFMVMFQAPFTLPGLAGLVLTVAMSVDANVLISERMREELLRGATLRMAIRNGFDKALSAIIDGNLTTFMTALILYIIGTDQIRGFGMTLMLGNITSMFTAIFCARVIFDVAERTRWIKSLSMASILTTPRVDWVRYFVPGIVASLILFAIGMGATVARGKGLFDTDLAGGTSVAFILNNQMSETELRNKLETVFGSLVDKETNTRVTYDVYSMAVATEQANSVYKVDSSLEDIDVLKAKVRESLRMPDGKDGVRTFQMSFGEITESKAGIAPPTTPATPPTIGPAVTNPGTLPAASPKDGQNPASKSAPEVKPPDKPAEEPAKQDPADCQEQPPAEPKGGAQPPAEPAPQATTPATGTLAPQAPVSPAGAPATSPALQPPVAPATVRSALESSSKLTFPKSPLSAEALREHLRNSGTAALNRNILVVDVDNPNWDRKDNSAFEEWTVKLALSKEDTAKVLAHLQGEISKNVVWQTSSKIGGQVSADTRWRAVGALAVSLLSIVAYVWFRFLKPAWGLAAVAALAHDALSMLTAIALSYWFAGALGFLGVEEFKISLPVVAAFLTILGYSVNDTIVIFDRLREIRGKSPDVTRDMLNAAVNQTLSRTIILAGITLTVVGVLYFFGGPGIHGFAFALLIGVISGCYTTLIIAAPLLYWMLGRKDVAPTKVAAREMAKTTV